MMFSKCIYCGDRVYPWRSSVYLAGGRVAHDLCYHDRADETWLRLEADGTPRRVSREEAAAHREWAAKVYGRPRNK